MGSIAKRIKNNFIKAIIYTLGRYRTTYKAYDIARARFLIISTTGVGDTLWGTPAIKALRETYPNAYIGALTSEGGFQLLKGNPNINGLFVFRRGIPGFFSIHGLLKTLRQKKFEVVFIFHASDRIIWPLAYFTGAGEIIGINGSSKGLDFILTKPVDLSLKKHGVENRLELVRQVSASTNQKSIEMFLTETERKDSERLLKEKGIAEDSFIIGLHPGAQKPYKCWPAENFIKFGNIFTEKFGCKVIVTGDSNEKTLAEVVSSKIYGAINMAGRLNLRETAAIIEKMRIFITNDTGPMHIAFVLETPTIALFSPTDPKLCGPYKATGKFRVISKPKTCNPCIEKKCYNPICMEQITVEEVLKSVESLIDLKLKGNR